MRTLAAMSPKDFKLPPALKVCTIPGLASGLRPGAGLGPCSTKNIWIRVRPSSTDLAQTGFGLFQILSTVIQNISALSAHFSSKEKWILLAHSP
jgi:hypothetical protein